MAQAQGFAVFDAFVAPRLSIPRTLPSCRCTCFNPAASLMDHGMSTISSMGWSNRLCSWQASSSKYFMTRCMKLRTKNSFCDRKILGPYASNGRRFCPLLVVFVARQAMGRPLSRSGTRTAFMTSRRWNECFTSVFATSQARCRLVQFFVQHVRELRALQDGPAVFSTQRMHSVEAGTVRFSCMSSIILTLPNVRQSRCGPFGWAASTRQPHATACFPHYLTSISRKSAGSSRSKWIRSIVVGGANRSPCRSGSTVRPRCAGGRASRRWCPRAVRRRTKCKWAPLGSFVQALV